VISLNLRCLPSGVIGSRVFGASYESALAGMGLRVEFAHYNDTKKNKNTIFWIAGIDYQFANGTLLAAEWYDNSRGANNVTSLINTNIQTDTFIKYGLQQQLSRNVLGISISKDISPLLNGGYTFLASPIKNTDGKLTTSLLHQINLTYSVSNESDILFSYQYANGQGLNLLGKTQSEFGHVPTSLAIRLRFYF